ncbi:nucleotide disphospho-sugar-binding domain-containing protein [Streptomyces sp. YS415]|uniref:glycosyltransferase n=1 Tax=Streptomyces sp. YS415 TaxID=2944806 RepID=UPI002021E652|nr:nucleotide disphospho-sugar-binding domain-containing protein [Streptomyces sp. YS415]MCL7430336.1 glycosyltransferase [Streptomyces sp. YS415]
MAEILVGTLPAAGHVLSLQPVVRELVARGHSVRWYTSDRYAADVEKTGARLEPMSSGLDMFAGPLNELYPERAQLKALNRMKWDLKHLFMGPSAAQAGELGRLHGHTHADVLLCDPGFGAIRMLSERVGVPWVSVGSAPLMLPSRDTAPFGSGLPPSSTSMGRVRNMVLRFVFSNIVMRDVVAHRDRLRREAGLPATREDLMGSGVSPYLHLQSGVAGLEYPRSDLPSQVHFIGSLSDEAAPAQAMPSWWDDVRSSGRPIVHVTQGTVANTELDNLLLPAFRALAREPVTVVATLGDAATTRQFPGLPPNAYIAPYLPYPEFLPHVSAMVTNGGFGGVNEALKHGVPLVVAGRTEEKPEVAARVAYAGAGIDLRTDTPDEAVLRTAVRRVLDVHSYRDRARGLAAEYSKVQAGPRSADLVEQLVSMRSSR